MFLRKYDITTLAIPHHKSHSCIVHLGRNNITSAKVALKFMIFKENFLSEIEIRSKGYFVYKNYIIIAYFYYLVSFESQFVVNIEESYDGTTDIEVQCQLKRFGIESFPYIIVMPAGERNLEMIMMSEQVAGIDWHKIKIYSFQIIEAVEHIHKKNYIHGDIKVLILIIITLIINIIIILAFEYHSSSEQFDAC